MTDRHARIGRSLIACVFWVLGWVNPANGQGLSSANVTELARHAGWIKLVHYEPDRQAPSGWRSAIHSKDFFLDPAQGPTSPLAELEATLQAMQAPALAEDASDAHASCRFPARRQWLQETLGESFKPVIPQCPRWQAWTRGERIHGLSIVFATGYLGNPASYYGHTFLKFEFGQMARSNLQDLTVNYGAIVEEPDDPVTYILKGVFGGYDGGFSDIAYHFHRTQYGENELRDLWEYHLNLTPEEARQVAAHAWEVLGQRYDYFFFRRNCAYRMAEIVQVLDGVGLIPAHRPWTLPQATIQLAAQSIRADGQPLVREITHSPSRQQRFYDSHDALGAAERQVLREVALRTSVQDHEGFKQLSLPGQQATLDALIDYHLFVVDPKDKEAGRLHPMYHAALAARYALPPGEKAAKAHKPAPPHQSRPASYLQLAWDTHPDTGGHGLLRFRAAYYDPLDADSAHVPYSALAMGDVAIRLEGSRARLHQLDLVNIESTNPGISGLPGDRGEAWRLKAGWEMQRPACQNCLTARVQADRGIGRRLSSTVHTTVLVGGALQTRTREHGPGFVRLTGTMLWQVSSKLGTRVQVERRLPVQARKGAYWTAQTDIRWQLRQDADVRITAQYDPLLPQRTTWRVGVGKYW